MRTNVNEIKAQLMQCIEGANDDPVLLQRILDKVKDAMNESCHNPMIYYEKVGKNIKRVCCVSQSFLFPSPSLLSFILNPIC